MWITTINNRREMIQNTLRKLLKTVNGLKSYICVCVEFSRTTSDGEEQLTEAHFNGKCRRDTSEIDIDANFRASLAKILESLNQFQREGSAWVIKRVLDLTLNVAIYKPIDGSSYIKLPTKLIHTRSIQNVYNEDNMCFTYAILSALHPNTPNGGRFESYLEYVCDLNMSGIKFPVVIKDVCRFERQMRFLSMYSLLTTIYSTTNYKSSL